MKISEYFGAALLFINVATQCESLRNIRITGTALRISESSNDYSVMEDGFLVVHCEEESNDITDVFVKVKLPSTFLCYVNEQYPLSKSIYDGCNNITKVRVEERQGNAGSKILSFAFYTPWMKYQNRKGYKDFRVCYCTKASSNKSISASLSPFSWPKPAIIKSCSLHDYSNISCEWAFDNNKIKGKEFSTVLSYKDNYSGIYLLCRKNIALNNCTDGIGNFDQSIAGKDYQLMIRAELHVKFEMNFPNNFNVSTLNKYNINVSMDKENSALTFAYPFEDNHVYKLGTDKLIPRKPEIAECENLHNPSVKGTSVIIPIQPSKNFLKVTRHYDVELNLHCRLSSNEDTVSDKDTNNVYVINGSEDPCGFCKFEDLAPATNYKALMSLIGVDDSKEYGYPSENTVYPFTTKTTDPQTLPQSFYYIQNGIEPSVTVIWNWLSRRQAGGKTVAYRITEKQASSIVKPYISRWFEGLYFICVSVKKGLSYSIRVESTWSSNHTFNFPLLKRIPDQINLPASWTERQPENILVTAYIDHSMNNNKVVIVWSHWEMNATEYILILCRNQENFLKGCTNNMEIFKIPLNQSIFEYSIKLKLAESVMKNFSVALSVKYEDNFTSGLIFSPCVFKQNNLRFNGVIGDDIIDNIKTKVKGKIIHSIVNLKKNPCELDIFFTYVVVYFCVSKNDICIGDSNSKTISLGKKSAMTIDLGIASEEIILVWAKVGSYLGESTNSSKYQKTLNLKDEKSSKANLVVFGVVGSFILVIIFIFFAWKLRAAFWKFVRFPLERNFPVILNDVSSGHPNGDEPTNNEQPNQGATPLLPSNDSMTDAEKNSQGSSSQTPIYVEIKHDYRGANGFAQNEPLKNEDDSRPTANGYLPRDSVHLLASNNPEKTSEVNLNLAKGATASPLSTETIQLNVENGSTNGQSSQLGGGSGSYVDPSVIFSKKKKVPTATLR